MLFRSGQAVDLAPLQQVKGAESDAEQPVRDFGYTGLRKNPSHASADERAGQRPEIRRREERLTLEAVEKVSELPVNNLRRYPPFRE